MRLRGVSLDLYQVSGTISQPMEIAMTQHLPDQPDIKSLRVGSGTDCQKLSLAIAGSVERRKPCIVEFIGAGAGNQAIKAVILANGLLGKRGLYLSIVPQFVKRVIKEEEVSAIQYHVIVHRVSLSADDTREEIS